MASITIRQLDEELKQRLRLRAARHGRSMEDEARTMLRQAAALVDDGHEGPTGQRRPTHSGPTVDAAAPAIIAAPGLRHVLLVIGGGIAAYKSLDLIRRLKERGLAVRCVL